MTKTLHGKVRGRTIELNEDPGVAEGQEVEVRISVVGSSSSAIRSIADAFGTAPVLRSGDDILAQVRAERDEWGGR